MERVARMLNVHEHYLRWTRSREADDPADASHPTDAVDSDAAILRLVHVVQSILLWENSRNSVSAVVVFNVFFWGIVILEVRGFAAASSAALVVVLFYSTLEAQIPKEKGPKSSAFQARTEHVKKFANKTKSTLESLKQMRQEQPGAFCSVVCTVSIGLWLLGRTVNGVLIAYITCMSILLGPILLIQISCRAPPKNEWDSEIEEFLPAATEDNLHYLKKAGDPHDRSPTPYSDDDSIIGEDLVGMQMPSHEDIVDGSEVPGDGMKFQCGHFERSSSSEEEIAVTKLSVSSRSEDSDSEFEIIDRREVAAMKNI